MDNTTNVATPVTAQGEERRAERAQTSSARNKAQQTAANEQEHVQDDQNPEQAKADELSDEVESDNGKIFYESDSDHASDNDSDLDVFFTSPAKKRFARKSAKAKASARGVTRVAVDNAKGKKSTMVVNPDAAKERAKKAITSDALLKAVIVEIDNFYSAQDSDAPGSHSSNNMVRRIKGSLSKSLATFQATGNTDDQLPSKAAILATIYTHPQGNLNGDIGGTLSAMNRLDLAQPGLMEGSGPRTYNAFEKLCEVEHDTLKAQIDALSNAAADNNFAAKITELEEAVNDKTPGSRFSKALANIKEALQRKANTTDVDNHISGLKKEVSAATNAAKAANDAVKEMRKELAKLKTGSAQALPTAPPTAPWAATKKRAGPSLDSPSKRPKTTPNSGKKSAGAAAEDDDIDFDDV